MRIDRHSLSSLIVFIAGVIACFGRWRADFFPKSIFAAILFLCVIGTFAAFRKPLKINGRFFLSWYGVFFLFVTCSLLWTQNYIDPEVIIKRLFFVFITVFLIIQNIYSKETFHYFLKGLIFGSIATLAITLYIEKDLLGIYRIGSKVSGSENVFGSILSAGLIASFILNIQTKRKIYLLYAILCFIGSALSGSRLPLAFCLLAFLIFYFYKANNFAKKLKMLLAALVIAIISAYSVLNVPVLYNAIGFRFELFAFALLHGDKVDHSFSKRSAMKEEAMKLWLESPVIGNGVNSFWVLSPVTEGNATSHSGFTEILCCFGIIGFILFYWPFFRNALFLKKFNRKSIIFKSLFLITFLIFVTDWQEIYFQNTTTIALLAAAFTFFKYRRNILEV
ncbi:MAG: O-antigen ligase family protein [Fibromonadaceae bacterium]|jgi:branched-subunit amino acid transport protein AzlD|nr:O-antigen ligase family protein [Fibromonadaceae bacterium]